MSGKCPDRIPTMPQICFGHAVNIFYDDYRKGIADVIENPLLHYELMLKTAKHYQVDGLRLFLLPESYKVFDDGQTMAVLDSKTEQRIGKVTAQRETSPYGENTRTTFCSLIIWLWLV